MTDWLCKRKPWLHKYLRSAAIASAVLGVAAGATVVTGARILCLLLTRNSRNAIDFGKQLFFTSHPCPCAALVDTRLPSLATAFNGSALHRPVLVMTVALSAYGAAALARRIVPMGKSIWNRLLDESIGFLLGMLAGDLLIVGAHGGIWEITRFWRTLGEVRILPWAWLPLTLLVLVPVWNCLAQVADRTCAQQSAHSPSASEASLQRPTGTDSTFGAVAPQSEGKSPYKANWSDRAIESIDDDIFGRAEIARTICREALRPGASVIALVGEYGTGKSSVLNLAADRLLHPIKPGESKDYEPSVVPIVVRFNAWLPDDGITLTAAFLRELQSAIASQYIVPGISKRMRDLMRVFASSLPHASSDVGRLLPERSQQDQVKEFCRILERLPVPVVVLIDEVDRMAPSEVGELFKLLRGFPETPNLRFVCALDLKNTAGALQQQRPGVDSAQYIEKFFPVRVALSEIEGAQFNNYFGTFLKSLKDDFPDDNWQEIETWVQSDPVAAQVLNNPRRIKSVFASFRSNFQQVAGEVNELDLFRLEVATVLKPTVREAIYARWYCFLSLSEGAWIRQTGRIADKSPDAAQQRSQVYRSVLGEPTSPEADGLIRLVGQMFPLVTLWIEAGNPDPGTGFFPNPEERRIHDRRFFPIYFIRREPAEQFSRAKLHKLIADLKKATEPQQVQDRFADEFESVLKTPTKCVSFLNLFDRSLPKAQFSRNTRGAIARALAASSSKVKVPFPLHSKDSDGAVCDLALKVTWACASTGSDGHEKYDADLLAEFVGMAGLEFATALFLDRAVQAGPQDPGGPDAAVFTFLKKSMVDRLTKNFIDTGLKPADYLAKNGEESVCLTVAAWAACGPEARQQALRYFAVQNPADSTTNALFIARTWRKAPWYTFRQSVGVDLPEQVPSQPLMIAGLLYPVLEDLRPSAEAALSAIGPEDPSYDQVQNFVSFLNQKREHAHGTSASGSTGSASDGQNGGSMGPATEDNS